MSLASGDPTRCNMCDRPATVLDTEYDEYYCDEHARQYQVHDGPHEPVDQ
jgi:hypothetical protein